MAIDANGLQRILENSWFNCHSFGLLSCPICHTLLLFLYPYLACCYIFRLLCSAPLDCIYSACIDIFIHHQLIILSNIGNIKKREGERRKSTCWESNYFILNANILKHSEYFYSGGVWAMDTYRRYVSVKTLNRHTVQKVQTTVSPFHFKKSVRSLSHPLPIGFVHFPTLLFRPCSINFLSVAIIYQIYSAIAKCQKRFRLLLLLKSLHRPVSLRCQHFQWKAAI